MELIRSLIIIILGLSLGMEYANILFFYFSQSIMNIIDNENGAQKTGIFNFKAQVLSLQNGIAIVNAGLQNGKKECSY